MSQNDTRKYNNTNTLALNDKILKLTQKQTVPQYLPRQAVKTSVKCLLWQQTFS